MTQSQAPLLIDGSALTCDTVARVARDGASVQVDPSARARALEAWEQGERIAQRRQVYGRTTGVGANRHEEVSGDAARGHALRLLHSHATGVGPLLPPDHVRAALVVRLNQLARGGSGVHPRMIDAFVQSLSTGALPHVHQYGAIGTGDLTMLAEIGLTLAGERPWGTGQVPSIPIDVGDALALMSSNAATLGAAALTCRDLQALLRASHVIAALSFCALDGSPEAYAAAVHEARPHPGQVLCAAEMRRLLGLADSPTPPGTPPGRRLQDPYGLRAFPQVQGPALDSAVYLERILEIEINASAENPLISVSSHDVFHHANFHTAYVAVALDQTRATLHQVAELSLARLSDLVEPAMTAMSPFLASGPPGSSGVMILEYVAHDALAQMRQSALPVTLGTAVVSRGLEDHASFSTQAARQTTAAVHAFRYVLACEFVSAVRAVRMKNLDLADLPIDIALSRAKSVLDPSFEDRSLTFDVERSVELLPELAEI